MTKFVTAAVAAMTVAFAGGDVTPIEVVEVTPANNFYVGGALTATQTYVNGESNWFSDTDSAETGYGFGAQAGYTFYRCGAFEAALEGRIQKTFWDYGIKGWEDNSEELTTYSALIKPQYNFDEFGVYGLVGYGASKFEIGDFKVRENGLVYGAGAQYAINDSWAVFGDYTVNPAFEVEGFKDIENDVVAIGVNYKF